MAYKIVWESPDSVRVRFSGEVTFGQTVSATNEVYADPRCDDIAFAFWDFLAADSVVVSEGDVEEMAFTDHAASLYMKPLKSAFIITDPALKALGEQYIETMRELGSPWQNGLFASLDDARRWALEPPRGGQSVN